MCKENCREINANNDEAKRKNSGFKKWLMGKGKKREEHLRVVIQKENAYGTDGQVK